MRAASTAAAPGAVEPVAVPATRWRDTCIAARDAGERFEGMSAVRRDDALELRAVFSTATGERLLVCRPGRAGIDTIVDELPAANWDEREVHDLYGLHFAGHEPMRALLDHTAPLDQWTTPVGGHDPHQVAVGPVHAGVIESGHFRFHVVGERILALDLRLFYKRRGLEAAAAGQPLSRAIAYAQRACAACAVTNAVAYAQACESALGLEPDRALRRGRTLLLELERVYNHLHDISAICAGVGFAVGTMAYAALKERVQRLNERLTGHRFLFGTTELGRSRLALAGSELAAAREELRGVAVEHAATWRQLQFAISLQERLLGVGVLATADAERLGAVGPAARAAGVRRDVRSQSPRLWYDGFEPVVAERPDGDVASRMAQRGLELDQSFAILDDLLARPLPAGEVRASGEGCAFGLARVESPRGSTLCLVERRGQALESLHLRTGSYANWPVVSHVVPGNLVPDFPLINKSFELCYACVDR